MLRPCPVPTRVERIEAPRERVLVAAPLSGPAISHKGVFRSLGIADPRQKRVDDGMVSGGGDVSDIEAEQERRRELKGVVCSVFPTPF